MLCALSVTLETEAVGLADAQGRVLAVDVAAVIPSPPFDRSPLTAMPSVVKKRLARRGSTQRF